MVLHAAYAAFDIDDPSPAASDFGAKLTGYVVFSCVVAASGGFLFGESGCRLPQCSSFRIANIYSSSSAAQVLMLGLAAPTCYAAKAVCSLVLRL